MRGFFGGRLCGWEGMKKTNIWEKIGKNRKRKW